MSNFIVGGWSALKSELHHATELFGRSAGPDGAIERIKFGVSEVLSKFESLAEQEPEDAPAEADTSKGSPGKRSPGKRSPVEAAPVEAAPVEAAPEGSFDHTNPDAQ